jgi:hypothetical protein
MASGHVNRTNRPNTWLHRPSLPREDSLPCLPGAVHTWPLAGDTRTCRPASGHSARPRAKYGTSGGAAPAGTVFEKIDTGSSEWPVGYFYEDAVSLFAARKAERRVRDCSPPLNAGTRMEGRDSSISQLRLDDARRICAPRAVR